MDGLEEFHKQFQTDIMGTATSEGALQEESFFELVGDMLNEAGEIDTPSWSRHEGEWKRRRKEDAKTLTKSIAVTGYSIGTENEDSTLSLILADFRYSDTVRSMGVADVKILFGKLVEFLRAARSEEFRDAIEETSDGAILCDLIWRKWSQIEKIKLIIATTASTTTKADAYSAGEVDGKSVTYNVWDLKRLRKYVEQGQAREDLVIDLEKDFGGSIPILKAFGGDAALESYLAVINGDQLANIYNKWGARLLESNVRSFLQARGNVNRGIRDTIVKEPHMFLPYNNGITATADAVTISKTDDGLVLSSVENLQIVNGGQTTASLHAAMKTASEQLKNVYVQMKLNIVPKEVAEDVVPKISEYANTQNKVNAADFFSNHPFHIRMEEFSRKIYAPAGENGFQDTKWFYERARGQYADARGNKTPAERKKFDGTYPRSGFFTKTDLAKYENSFRCEPHIVSLGAQKNFANFAKSIGTRWGKDGVSFDETWYKRLVAKAIVFRATEKLVSAAAETWYEGGYRANIVTYGIAKVVSDVTEMNKAIDLDRVWRLQRNLASLEAALDIACCEAQEVILNPVAGMRHIGEWAKKEACWKALKERELEYPEEFLDALVDPEYVRSVAQEARADSDLTKDLIGESWVIEVGADFWQDVLNWGAAKKALSPMDDRVLSICAAIPSKIPSAHQAKTALRCLEKLKGLGYTHVALEAGE